MKLIHKIIGITVLVVVLNACKQPGGESAGSEYMPDMAHSIAYEANYYNYYHLNTWGSEEEYYKYAMPKLPVDGTVARGSIAGASNSKMSIPQSGSVPYYYGDTEEERARATAELVNNPFPITAAGLAEGKNLYTLYCGICHGDKGDGGGYLVRDGGAYPVQPANFLLDEFVTSSNGRYYHSIMYGKNLMGSYTDKLSHDERWQVIHYIRSLQAKEKKLAYSQTENTLNAIDVPGGDMSNTMIGMKHDANGHHDAEHGAHDELHGDHHDGEGHDDHEGHDHDHEGDHKHDHDDHHEGEHDSEDHKH